MGCTAENIILSLYALYGVFALYMNAFILTWSDLRFLERSSDLFGCKNCVFQEDFVGTNEIQSTTCQSNMWCGHNWQLTGSYFDWLSIFCATQKQLHNM